MSLSGHVLVQPVDEFNRPGEGRLRRRRACHRTTSEIDTLFAAWRESAAGARKFLPAARDYLAASLWRRGRAADPRDGECSTSATGAGTSVSYGKLHVRFGKGSYGRGPKTRLVPGSTRSMRCWTWWLTDIRHQFGDDYDRSGRAAAAQRAS